MTKFTWNDENTAILLSNIEGVSLVSQDMLQEIATEIGHTARGVGSKIRQLVKAGVVSVEVQKAADANKVKWAEAEEAELIAFLDVNSGAYTYNEVAATLLGGKFSSKEVQGKVLSLEMTDKVKKAEKVAAKRTYTEAEEATYIELANAETSLEDIAAALGRPMQSVRGKGLSLQREGKIAEIPVQAVSTAKGRVDFLEPILDRLDDLTIAEIAEEVQKTERGVKNTLTRRGLSCKDHNGAGKRKNIDAKAE